jgi:hypothetical protein
MLRSEVSHAIRKASQAVEDTCAMADKPAEIGRIRRLLAHLNYFRSAEQPIGAIFLALLRTPFGFGAIRRALRRADAPNDIIS